MKTITENRCWYNGYLYRYAEIDRCPYYTSRILYRVLTNNPRYCVRTIVKNVLDISAVSKIEWDANYKANPSMENALREYYTSEFVPTNEFEGFNGYWRIMVVTPNAD